MKSIHKKVVLIILVVVFSLSIFSYIYFKSINTVQTPHFIQYDSYVAAEKDSSYIFNLTYFVSRYGKDQLKSKSIQRISFENTNGIEITHFQFVEGSTSSKYKIMTLAVTTKFAKEYSVKIDCIKVAFNDGSNEYYKIGDWKFDILSSKNGNDLRVGERYPLMTERLVDYTLALDNLSDNEIKIKKFVTDLKGIDFSFTSINMKPKQSIREIILPISKDGSEKENSFYYLRPLVQYEKNEITYNFYPDGVYFGLLKINDDIIDREIKKAIN